MLLIYGLLSFGLVRGLPLELNHYIDFKEYIPVPGVKGDNKSYYSLF